MSNSPISLVRTPFPSIHRGKSRRHSSGWLTTSVIVFFNYNKVNSSITSPSFLSFIPRLSVDCGVGRKTELASASSVGRREGLLQLKSVISIQEEDGRTQTTNWNIYPWLLVVISVPSANWAQISSGPISALFEIDLFTVNLQPSSLTGNQSVNQFLNQLRNTACRAGVSVSQWTNKVSTRQGVQKVS